MAFAMFGTVAVAAPVAVVGPVASPGPVSHVGHVLRTSRLGHARHSRLATALMASAWRRFFWVKNRNLQNTMSENVFKIFKTEMSENVLLQRFNESSKMNAYYEEITVIKTKTFRRKILIYGYLDM